MGLHDEMFEYSFGDWSPGGSDIRGDRKKVIVKDETNLIRTRV